MSTDSWTCFIESFNVATSSAYLSDALQELGNFVDSDDDVENGNTEQESDTVENTTEEE